MPRLARLDAPGVLHHVMGRGIERRKIFRSDGDRNDFIDRLSALVQKGAMEIYAWVLMPNHFHLLCKAKNLPLASSMRKILTGYKELIRYIHLNLLRAGRVKDLKELDRSLWSGHSALVGKVKRQWQNTDYVLLSGQRIDIHALAEKVSERYNIFIGELRSGSRRRAAVKTRHAISWIGVREPGYSGADVARYLGVTNSCVTRLIAAGRKQDTDDINLEL